jgi:hypothetical protein
MWTECEETDNWTRAIEDWQHKAVRTAVKSWGEVGTDGVVQPAARAETMGAGELPGRYVLAV